jgi:hypothetical protein
VGADVGADVGVAVGVDVGAAVGADVGGAARQNQMVFRRDEISNMWVPDIQHEAHDAPVHVRIDASSSKILSPAPALVWL